MDEAEGKKRGHLDRNGFPMLGRGENRREADVPPPMNCAALGRLHRYARVLVSANGYVRRCKVCGDEET